IQISRFVHGQRGGDNELGTGGGSAVAGIGTIAGRAGSCNSGDNSIRRNFPHTHRVLNIIVSGDIIREIEIARPIKREPPSRADHRADGGPAISRITAFPIAYRGRDGPVRRDLADAWRIPLADVDIPGRVRGNLPRKKQLSAESWSAIACAIRI